jgi:hypothetical protein
MTMRSHCPGEIDPVHQTPAKKGAQGIRVIRQDEFGHFRL